MEQRAYTKVFSNIFSGTLFLNNIKRFFFLPIVHFLYSLMAPMLIYVGAHSNYYESTSTEETIIYVGNAINTLISPIYIMIMACVMVYAVFSYLYNTKNCYMMHAFPITRLCMYVTNLISAFVMLALPTGVTMLICIPMSLSLGVNVLVKFLSAYVLFILMTLFFISVAAFVAMCTGTGAAMPILYIIFNFLGEIIIAIRNNMAGIFFFGCRFDYEGYTLTPVLRLNSYVNNYAGRSDFGTSAFFRSIIIYIAVLMIIALVLAVVTYLIYEHKQVESVGSLLPMYWTRPIFSWGVVICSCAVIAEILRGVFFIYYSMPDKVLAMYILVFILGGILIFFGIQMLIARTVHIFSKAKAIEFTAVTVMIIIALIAMYINPADIGIRIPDVKDIAAVEMVVGENKIYLEEKDISKLLEINQEIIDNREEIIANQDWRIDCDYYISADIVYYMNSGYTVYRNYELRYSDDGSAVAKIGDKFADLVNRPDIMENTMLQGMDIGECNPELISINVINERELLSNGDSHAELYERSNIQQALEAITMDAREGKVKILSPKDEWNNDNCKYILSIEYTSDTETDYNITEVYVYKDSTNTLKAIEELVRIE